jgi:hypothetical protein
MMNNEAKAGRSDQADESNSTEHDVTVSLSGTDEFNDTHSVFSDGLSVASKASKLNDARKIAHKMSKLKEENMLLKEALEKANASDITMLKSKLRGSHADLVRLRQNNSELKDRIQVLEGRLFNALSLQTTKNSSMIDSAQDATNAIEPPSLNERREDGPAISDSKFTSSERAHLMDMVKSMQARCKHLARLVQSYESKINAMQTEADARAAASTLVPAVAGKEQSQSIEFNVVEQEGSAAITPAEPTATLKSALKGSTGKPYLSRSSGGRKQVQIDPDEVEARIAKAREGDLKMVRELSAEVRRLVALLPRESVDVVDSEQTEEAAGDADAGAEDGDTSRGEGDTETRLVSKNSSSSSSSGGSEILRRGTSGSVAGELGRGTASKDAVYSPGQLLCSFFAGVLVMLLCVALSAYGTYYATSGSGGDEGSDPLHRSTK